ncbi:MAG: N-glycosylase/DNA lyase [Vulcanisaeta sp. AZ3]|jgi:DNA-(apurinic or apyrimidinic site) lyase|nr:MAG: DNA lyase [Vulcanisaeta sp. AZ3]
MTNINVKNTIASTLHELGIEWIRKFEEKDPQFLAIKRLCDVTHDLGVTLKLTILNALISYQLTGKGEDHWNYFANYFISNKPSDLCRDFTNYTMSSKYLARYKASRIKRINTVCPKLIKLDLTDYIKDLVKLWRLINEIVGGSGDEKTIVFSVKMAYYVSRTCGHSIEVPMEIPIPVDYRVTVITICSGLININNEKSATELAKEIMIKRKKEIQEIWSDIAKSSGVPPLNLDSVVWVLGGLLINSYFNINEAINKLRQFGIPINDGVVRLLHLLSGRCIAR